MELNWIQFLHYESFNWLLTIYISVIFHCPVSQILKRPKPMWYLYIQYARAHFYDGNLTHIKTKSYYYSQIHQIIRNENPTPSATKIHSCTSATINRTKISKVKTWCYYQGKPFSMPINSIMHVYIYNIKIDTNNYYELFNGLIPIKPSVMNFYSVTLLIKPDQWVMVIFKRSLSSPQGQTIKHLINSQFQLHSYHISSKNYL